MEARVEGEESMIESVRSLCTVSSRGPKTSLKSYVVRWDFTKGPGGIPYMFVEAVLGLGAS